MRILDRHVFREVAGASLIGTALFTLVLFLQQVEPVMELLVGHKVPAGAMAHLLALTLPQSLPFTIPMGVLTGVLISLGRLSSDNEVLAIVASGLRSRSLARPVSMVAILALLVCALATLWLTPWSLREQARIAESLQIQLAGTEVVPRVFIEDFPDHVIWVQDVVPSDGIHWKGIFLADMRTAGRRGSISGPDMDVAGPHITLGTEAFVIPRPEQGRVQVRFPQTTTYVRSRNPEQYLAFRSAAADQVLQSRPPRFDPGAKRLNSMPTSELWRAVSQGSEPTAVVLLHDRFSLPFACWLLPLASLPLAISIRRPSRASGAVLAMLLCFSYWMISLAGTALAERGDLPPALASWSASGIFAIAGLAFLARADTARQRDGQAAGDGRWAQAAKRLMRSTETRDGESAPRPVTRDPLDVLVPVVDRYVLRKFLFYLAMLMLAFISIWYVFSFFELLSDMLTRDKLGSFVPYIYFLTPFLVYNTAPLAVMVSTLLCFGVMGAHNEIIGFRSCGVSLYRLALPILVGAGGLSAGLFALEESLLPGANMRQDALRDEIKGHPPRTYLRPDRQWTFGLANRIFYHRAFDSRSETFSGISVFDLRSEPFELRRHIHAESARWDDESAAWVFENGWVRELSGIKTDAFETFAARAFPSIREEPAYFLKQNRHDQQMNLAQLRAYIRDLTQSGFDTVRLQVSMHKKLAFPLFAFAMALVSVPFAMQTSQRGSLWPVGLGLGLTVAFYAVTAFSEQLGRAGQLQPPLAAWAPCLLFVLGGGYFLLRMRT
ncbi:MAG: LptF/LptG family permease [Bryobacterales bacterium]|nr:LptF/LptG family permease [Bryobacterales bacterium]